MKVIDLLNKIANGEEVPKIIKYKHFEYKYNDVDKEYQRRQNKVHYGLGEDIRLDISLNDEIEIIEEDKKVEKMECNVESWFTPSQADIEIIKKLNELIDIVNELKGEEQWQK